MYDLKKALSLILKDEQHFDWYVDSSDSIQRKVAYNAALNDISEFIKQYENGDIANEYLVQLEKRQG